MKKTTTLLLVLIAAVMLGGCTVSQPAEDIAASEQQEVTFTNVSPEAFEALMAEDHLLLDVRTQEEYDAGHIDDPVLIPVDELDGRIDEIAEYKDEPVLVYCRSGNRSVTASQILLENGFTKVYNLVGGISGWQSYKGE